MKRLGPELKMPDLKGMQVPTFLADVYYDLRERRLLPLVALVVVAIAAVPFLLGGDAEEPVPPPAPGSATAEDEIAGASTLTVVEAKPGLRDYRKRLRKRTPTDPFKQRYTGLPKGVQLESTVAASATTGGEEAVAVSEVEGSGTSPSGSAPGPSGGSGGGSAGGDEPPRLIAFVVDVQILRSEETPGGRKMSEPSVHRKVKPFTQLPGKKAPVVTTMGVNLRTAKILFLVSDDVKSLEGDYECVSRTPEGLCELLAVEPGFPFDAIYGPNDVRYRFKVTKVDAVWDGRVGDKRGSGLEADYGAAFDGRFGFGFAAVVGQFQK